MHAHSMMSDEFVLVLLSMHTHACVYTVCVIS